MLLTVAAGKEQETGWIDINLPDIGSEQEELSDSEPSEEELKINLGDVDHEDLPLNELDDEGIVLEVYESLYALNWCI